MEEGVEVGVEVGLIVGVDEFWLDVERLIEIVLGVGEEVGFGEGL